MGGRGAMSQQRLQLTWYNKDMALIPTEDGRYAYRWVDPADPRYCETRVIEYDDCVEGEQTPKQKSVSYSERADLEPQRDNLMILGESGDVLEALVRTPELAEKYVGKVKLVYIDPPFNTEKAFPSYEDNLEHSIWLTMMRDRLLNLKRLISDDGSIWVHLDDAEVHRMRTLLDEVFGAENFVAEIVWQKADSGRNDAEFFSTDQDFILVYRKTSSFMVNRLPRTAADNARFNNPDHDPNGEWFDGDPTAPGARTHQGMVYAIQQPITGELIYPAKGRCWSFEQAKLLEVMSGWAPYRVEMLDDAEKRADLCGVSVDEIRRDIGALVLDIPLEEAAAHAQTVLERGNWPMYILRSGGRGGLGRKSYIPNRLNVPRTWWGNSEVGHNRTAKAEIKALFPGDTPFSTPKPERLLERIIYIATNPGDIVLDCFAGSGTTAAVAQKMGRKWVTCELLESTFNTFTRSRLEKVVRDEDPGGITANKPERVAAEGVELPEGVNPDEAAKFTSILNKLVADNPDLKNDKTVKQLKKLAKTRNIKGVVNWRGGGGFQVAHLAPACFDYDENLDRVVLTNAATGPLLVKSIAANLGFSLLEFGDWDVYDGQYFDGYRGNTVLKVWEGIADTELVDWLVSRLRGEQSMILATTQALDGVREYLRRARRGSRLILIPDELFPYTKGGVL